MSAIVVGEVHVSTNKKMFPFISINIYRICVPWIVTSLIIAFPE